jgi:hypothetical protein
MLSGILSLLGILPKAFGTIDNITNAISNERIKKISAQTDQERIKADERINSLQAKRDVLVAESGSSRINSFIRAGIAVCATIPLAKLFVWDKVVGSFYGCAGSAGRNMMGCETFRTDPLDANQWAVITAVVGFYFLYEGAMNVTRIAKS